MTTQSDLKDLNAEDVLTAVVVRIGHTGAQDVQVRFWPAPEDEDPGPVIWTMVAIYDEAGRVFEAASGASPALAAWRLAEQLLDGGICLSCDRSVSLTLPGQEEMSPVFHALDVCQYRFVPASKEIIRGCELTHPHRYHPPKEETPDV